MWRDKIQISRKCGKPVSKTHKHCQCWAWSGVIDTQIFSRPPSHLWVKKRYSLTLNTKLRLQLSIRMALVQEICLHGKRLENNFKITQSN